MTHDYINYRKRVVLEGTLHDTIRYGMDAKTANADGGLWWRDVNDEYGRLSVGGRRPGEAQEVRKHFFNKRIMTDDERKALPSSRDRDGVRASDAGGGVAGAGQVAFPRTVAGSGAGGDPYDAGSSDGEI